MEAARGEPVGESARAGAAAPSPLMFDMAVSQCFEGRPKSSERCQGHRRKIGGMGRSAGYGAPVKVTDWLAVVDELYKIL